MWVYVRLVRVVITSNGIVLMSEFWNRLKLKHKEISNSFFKEIQTKRKKQEKPVEKILSKKIRREKLD